MNTALRAKIKNLPTGPGVYHFKNASGALLYIGKAKSLKKRVASYFAKRQVDDKTKLLVAEIADVDIITTNTETEAFLLEASLIRKNKPPYNIDLKESSGRYAYLKMTNEEFPRLVVARTAQDKKNGTIFGPYTSAATRREAQYLARTTFKLRTCRTLPKRACLLYHINLCDAPCIGKISKQEYNDNVKKAEEFLRGNVSELKARLKKEMKDLAEKKHYEQAKVRRDQITAIAGIAERQTIDLPKGYDQDVFAYISTAEKMIVQLFNVVGGLVSGKKEFNATRNDFSEFLRRYYDAHPIPEEIITNAQLEDQAALAAYLSERRGGKATITIPQKGSKKDLLDLLQQNLEMSAKVGSAVLYELQQALNLPTLPKHIEMFDISHLGGTDIVASMVQFTDAQANKSEYRSFRMRTVRDNDDFASMREVVARRYKYLLAEGKPLPDLIIVDGGRGQLSSALGVLQDLGVTTPLIALAKREEEIYTVGRRFPVRLPPQSEGLKLLQRIRDEAHRFAITYQKKRRSMRLAGRS
jgi:excinuclease ABC subunit C